MKDNFEDTIKQLENIVNELENDELDLDTSVKKFEKGMELSKKCTKILEDAEKRISILINKEGELQEEKILQRKRNKKVSKGINEFYN